MRCALSRLQSSSKHAEFVAAEPCEGVGRADTGLQDARHLLQQAVAGLVATGVVDHLELVEVQIQHDVANFAIGARGLQGRVDTMFEFAAIDQAGEGVVGRLVGERALQPALLADVVEDHDDADQPAGPVANRCGRVLHRDFMPATVHEQ